MSFMDVTVLVELCCSEHYLSSIIVCQNFYHVKIPQGSSALPLYSRDVFHIKDPQTDGEMNQEPPTTVYMVENCVFVV